MPIRQEIELYRRSTGAVPFKQWLAGLASREHRAQLIKRIERVEAGLFGDTRSVGHGVHELRSHVGPGHRIYFARPSPAVVLILTAGTKATQKRDIARARRYWLEYRSLHDG